VSALLFDAVEVALDAAAFTDGLVDPTVGHSLRSAGYDATFKVVAARDTTSFRACFVPTPGWHVVKLDRDARTISVPAGVELDLGATGKAFAADRCAARAAAAVGCGVLVSLGGDVAVAGAAPDGGWAIGLADDHEGAAIQQTVAIASGGLATSSTAVRRWRSGDALLHHVIDPRTGRPAETSWRTVSVAAASCVAANRASTAALILDAAAPAWLAERSLAARLVGNDDAVVTVGGWPADVPL
jgi:thiamine biosynthesis lipoprotein